MNKLNSWTDIYRQYQSYLISFAFRMTGSLSEAEEIVQETFLECDNYKPSEIKNHKAWLTKICSNKSINHLQSAQKRREFYPGVWLPDEIPSGMDWWSDEESKDLSSQMELAESLTTSFLLLLEKLTPEQRAIFLLKEVFSYSFTEISELIGKSNENCRKIAQRAKNSINSEKVNFSHPPENALSIISELFHHAKNGNKEGLKKLLSKDAELFGDGGGKVSSAGHLVNSEQILSFLVNLGTSEVFRSANYKFEYRNVNHRPGLIISKKGSSQLWKLDTILSIEFLDNVIHRIYAQRSPDKLGALIKR